MKKNFYISVAGTMASGKTTAAKLLADHFKLYLLEENFGENVFLPRFYADMKRWAFHSQTFFLMEKTRQTLDTPKFLEKHSVVQDTPIQEDVFSYAKAQYVLGNIDDSEWRLYQKIYHSFEPYFPKPDLIVYLRASIPVVVKRIESRGREYEQKIPQAYLDLLDKLNHQWLRENITIPILTIETDGLNIVRSKTAKKEFIEKVKNKLKM